MITNTGKNILSKYLVGQTSSYASHIAVGSGATVLSASDGFGDNYSSKTSLDFEVARVPITSRGYQNVDGVENVVFTAEMPSAGQYEITEVGVFSGAKNPSSVGADSRTVLSFDSSESWEIHDNESSVAVPLVTQPLDSDSFFVSSISVSGGKLTVTVNNPAEYTLRILKINSRVSISSATQPAFNLDGFVVDSSAIFTGGGQTTIIISPTSPAPTAPYVAQDGVFYAEFGDGVFANPNEYRALRVQNNNSYFTPDGLRKPEKPRVATTSLMVRGDSAFPDPLNPASNPWHLHLSGINLDFSKNSPTDELRLAFSVTDASGATQSLMTSATFTVEFGGLESDTQRPTATFTGSPQQLAFGHYVVTKQIQDLQTSANFSWRAVNTARITVQIQGLAQVSGANPGYIIFDSMRLENVSAQNPLYGLTGYSVIKTDSGNPILKLSNTSTLVEFRFSMFVDTEQADGTP